MERVTLNRNIIKNSKWVRSFILNKNEKDKYRSKKIHKLIVLRF